MTRLIWTIYHGGPCGPDRWHLYERRRDGSTGRRRAFVCCEPDFTWHTFDRDGIGGENADAPDLYTAVRLATAAVLKVESAAGRSVIVEEWG